MNQKESDELLNGEVDDAQLDDVAGGNDWSVWGPSKCHWGGCSNDAVQGSEFCKQHKAEYERIQQDSLRPPRMRD